LNHVMLKGCLARDPEIRYTQGAEPMCVARYTIAVNRRGKRQDGQQNADFISCVAFGKTGEFVEKYLHKGTKIAVHGRIQTGSYTKQDGTKAYTTDVVVDEHEFCESKGDNAQPPQGATSAIDDFMALPDIGEELPFD